MRKDRIADLADIIEKHELPIGFSMISYAGYIESRITKSNPCGTVGCIAGWTCYAAYGPDRFHRRDFPSGRCFHEEARLILGLTRAQADALFTPPGLGMRLSAYGRTAQEVATVLRDLAQTGRNMPRWRLVCG